MGDGCILYVEAGCPFTLPVLLLLSSLSSPLTLLLFISVSPSHQAFYSFYLSLHLSTPLPPSLALPFLILQPHSLDHFCSPLHLWPLICQSFPPVFPSCSQFLLCFLLTMTVILLLRWNYIHTVSLTNTLSWRLSIVTARIWRWKVLLFLNRKEAKMEEKSFAAFP